MNDKKSVALSSQLPRTLLLVFGGGGEEHAVSKVSAGHIYQTLKEDFSILGLELTGGEYKIHLDTTNINDNKINDGSYVSLSHQTKNKIHVELKNDPQTNFIIDMVIPCFHGDPGETGKFQAYLEVYSVPYIGNDYKTNILCFDKILTKTILQEKDIPTSPFITLRKNTPGELKRAKNFFKQWKNCFLKASEQGSSVGCYPIKTEKDLDTYFALAFQFSKEVLLEKTIEGREVEVATYLKGGKMKASSPGEILCPQKFYSYEEKYDQQSQTKTDLSPKGLSEKTTNELKTICTSICDIFKIRHLARIDFFVESNQIWVNEINTFPGMTPISLFPKLMEKEGDHFKEFFLDSIRDAIMDT